jgi:hypothetical protein
VQHALRFKTRRRSSSTATWGKGSRSTKIKTFWHPLEGSRFESEKERDRTEGKDTFRLIFTSITSLAGMWSQVQEKVAFLELLCPQIDDTILLLMGVALKRCPNFMQLRMTSDQQGSEVGAKFMTSFLQLVRQFSHIDMTLRLLF